ncbi:MAG: DnaJ domain-containing protein [Acidimicrobiaceae bacterium]|nr:DnaJ domain-containing protein [Acidimicrobiaceae bacterium]
MEAEREWFEKDYYKILGIEKQATASEITKAYRKLAKELHPDVNKDSTTAEERFKQVTAAYDVLGDEKKRAAYDEVRRLGPAPGGFGNFGSGGSGRFTTRGGPGFTSEEVGFSFGGGPRGAQWSGNIEDLISNLGQPNRATVARGSDLKTKLSLKFKEAIFGTTATVVVPVGGPCRKCKGVGTRSGKPPKKQDRCDKCDGTGIINNNQGMFSLSHPCKGCAGRGFTIKKQCKACSGFGREEGTRSIKVRTPPGVIDGQLIKLKGLGNPSSLNGGQPGNLYARIHVSQHPLFKREDKNLLLTVPVTFAEAALGAKIEVPKLDGSMVRIRIPPGTTTGKRLLVRGDSTAGEVDMIVVIEVVIPKPDSLSDEQRTAIEALAAVSRDNPRQHLKDNI